MPYRMRYICSLTHACNIQIRGVSLFNVTLTVGDLEVSYISSLSPDTHCSTDGGKFVHNDTRQTLDDYRQWKDSS